MFTTAFNLLGKSDAHVDFSKFVEETAEEPLINSSASEVEYTFVRTGITILFSKPYNRFVMIIFHLKTACTDGNLLGKYRFELFDSINNSDCRTEVLRKITLKQISSNVSFGCDESLLVDTYEFGENKIRIAYSCESGLLSSVSGFYNTSALTPSFD